jgi:hypothetical protein
MSDASSIRLGAESELHRFWPAILACFVTAVFGWGFGFSGPSVYLAELQRAHGWSTGRIAAAITAYYLLGALCLARVDVALRWFGARYVVAAGTVLLGLGASLFARSQEPWELYVAAVPMALGWAGCTSTAISTTLALYFHRQRGLAIALALKGPVPRASPLDLCSSSSVRISASAMLFLWQRWRRSLSSCRLYGLVSNLPVPRLPRKHPSAKALISTRGASNGRGAFGQLLYPSRLYSRLKSD